VLETGDPNDARRHDAQQDSVSRPVSLADWPADRAVLVGVIADTSGRGVLVHTSPGGPTLTAFREGMRVTLLNADPQAANGRDWLRVRDENGIEGWVAAEYVAPAP